MARQMFGERLKLSRRRARHSLRSLSQALNYEVTAQAIGKYERGEMMPSSNVLVCLSKALGVTQEYLLSEQIAEIHNINFRKHAHASKPTLAHVEAELYDFLQRYITVEQILGVDYKNRTPRYGKHSIEDAYASETLARDLRRKWNLGIGPISNMTSLLEGQSVKVLLLDLPDSISGLSCLAKLKQRKGTIAVIVANKNMTLERRRFTLAHELAHLLIDRSSSVDHEKAADVFAGAFLVPEEHLKQEIGEQRKALGYRELIDLKHMYRVSAAMLLIRLEQLGIIGQAQFKKTSRLISRHWPKSEPVPLESDTEKGTHEVPRRFKRLCLQVLVEGLIEQNKAKELMQDFFEQIEQALEWPGGDVDSR